MENNTLKGDTGGSAPAIHINCSLIGSVEFNIKKELTQEELEKKVQKELASLLQEAGNLAE